MFVNEQRQLDVVMFLKYADSFLYLFKYFVKKLFYFGGEASEVDKNNRPDWLRAARELRTVILSGWKSYELDAAVDMLEGKFPIDC